MLALRPVDTALVMVVGQETHTLAVTTRSLLKAWDGDRCRDK